MPRRLLALAVAALALLAGAGCADDVSPAARIGDVKITNEAFLDEVAEWHGSPTLRSLLQIPVTDEEVRGTYPMSVVDFILGYRISFELHRAQFDRLGLELTEQDLRDVREGFFEDPADTEAVFEELSESYGRRLVEDVARQFAVAEAMGDDYQAWAADAADAGDIEVSPRYGSWDAASRQVLAPAGPLQPITTGP